jgi:RNA polymerase sigma factor (TIGR02999 family)
MGADANGADGGRGADDATEQGGVREGLDELLPALYAELRRLAARSLRSERAAHTLEPTALVNEAYLRLSTQSRVHWRDRAHILGAAATAMRRILVDHARARDAEKRGSGAEQVELDEGLIGGSLADTPSADLVALDAALEQLEAIDPRMVRVVELRFFAGLANEETAEALGISVATVKREWSMARAWLHRELSQ